MKSESDSICRWITSVFKYVDVGNTDLRDLKVLENSAHGTSKK